MSIKHKILLVLLAVLVLFAVANFVVVRQIVVPAFHRVESAAALRNMQRVENAISNELRHLANVIADWAAWDDTYRLIEDRYMADIELLMPCVLKTEYASGETVH